MDLAAMIIGAYLLQKQGIMILARLLLSYKAMLLNGFEKQGDSIGSGCGL